MGSWNSAFPRTATRRYVVRRSPDQGDSAALTQFVHASCLSFFDRVDGQPAFLKDPNCHCIDAQHEVVLNPKAWVDAAPGSFGTSAPYYDNYRWQRQPSEALSLGRNFRLANEGKVLFHIRAEFQNVFNRLFLA